MRSIVLLLAAANAAKCKKKTRDLGFKKEIDKLGLMKCAECPDGATGIAGFNFIYKSSFQRVQLPNVLERLLPAKEKMRQMQMSSRNVIQRMYTPGAMPLSPTLRRADVQQVRRRIRTLSKMYASRQKHGMSVPSDDRVVGLPKPRSWSMPL